MLKNNNTWIYVVGKQDTFKVHFHEIFKLVFFHQKYPLVPWCHILHMYIGFEYKIDFAKILDIEAHSAYIQHFYCQVKAITVICSWLVLSPIFRSLSKLEYLKAYEENNFILSI